jgi:hemerythrin
MPLLEWTPSLNVGIDEIDQEHLDLITRLNELYDSMQEQRTKAARVRILDTLVARTRLHFAHEERYMADRDYPDLPKHRDQHRRLLEQIVDVQTRFKARPGSTLAADVFTFLKSWFISHVTGSDLKYARYFRTRSA